VGVRTDQAAPAKKVIVTNVIDQGWSGTGRRKGITSSGDQDA
jgi:hypothetical protein